MQGHNLGGKRRPFPRVLFHLIALALLLLALAACGSAGGGATVGAPAATTVLGGASAARIPPVDGKGLGGQGRVGAPGLGAFLFFDAEG